MYVRVARFSHQYGTPESRLHALARVAAYRLHNLLNWRIPKFFGRDRCTECGISPCGTRIGPAWRCPLHSCWVASE